MIEMNLAQPNQSGKLRKIQNQSFEDWLEKVGKSRPEIVREMVKEILSTHQAEPLPDSVKKKWQI